MGTLTAFLIVRNEEALLRRCLDSLAGVADELAVGDTGSIDATADVLRAAARDDRLPPLRWWRQPFEGFGQARQAVLDRITTDWAFWIDADETVTPPLASRLAALKQSGELKTKDAWDVRLENRVFGRVMRGRNLAGQYRTRLFRVACGRISRSVVHEGLELAPGSRVGRLEEPLRHDTMTSWRRYLSKVDLYTDLEAAAGGRRFNPAHLLVTGPATFWREYISRTGWRDGWPGFVWAATTAWSSVQRDLKLRRRAARPKEPV